MSLRRAAWYAKTPVLAVLVLLLGSCKEDDTASTGTDEQNEQVDSMSANDPNRAGPDGHPIIFTEIERRDPGRVQALIDAGADIEAKGFASGTPILLAAVSANWRIAELLLAAGADPLIADTTGMTVMWLAAHSRLRPETEEGQALDRVRQVLNDRGIIGLVFPPRDVAKMKAEGQWPPEQGTEAP